MNHVKKRLSSLSAQILSALAVAALAATSPALADVPGRVGVRGTVPEPGTQQQELANITFPAPFNVLEFVVTCGACHGGTVDQQAAHFGNWAGTSMAAATRDPVFRANQMIANGAVKAALLQAGVPAAQADGAGNMCMRCHSSNAWYSGRFDPNLNGSPDGRTMIHSILASTDDEGVSCELCHRTMGSTTFQRPDLSPTDPAWNMMAGISGWPHDGQPFADQVGDPTLAPGNPYGNGTLQVSDNMTYNGRYSGSVAYFVQDAPLVLAPGADPRSPLSYVVGGYYTGQTYGTYPLGWIDLSGNDVGGRPVIHPDGTIAIQNELPIGAPPGPNGQPNYSAQSISLEHPTVRHPDVANTGFVQTPEFCGSCHDQTVPILNHGMPEQRTYTEWKFSALGREGPDRRTCQDCHMPRLQHEYSDATPVTVNADPLLVGWFPYGKPRNNTAFHKLAGANRDLPEMMKVLYPEVDIEVTGGAEGRGGVFVGTGNDPTIFPGVLSDRGPMWERNKRNTEVSLMDGVDVAIASGPTCDPATGSCSVQVKVTNHTGHRIPSGFAGGRRMWLRLEVKDGAGNVVYESGRYDAASARLFTDGAMTGLTRALTPNIDAAANAVMIYERVTGTCDYSAVPVACTPSLSPLNDHILFDNRIPPFGFDYAAYRAAGVKFWSYDPATFEPHEEYVLDAAGKPVSTRYPSGQNFDLVTYTFPDPGAAALSARAEVHWQTHSREFMDHLRVADASTVRPEGPPRPWALNYPFEPNYLSDEIGLAGVEAQARAAGLLASTETLRDNWGGIAWAAWFATNRGAPFLAAVADTASTTPMTPLGLRIFPEVDPVTGDITMDPATGQPLGAAFDWNTGLFEPYTQRIQWDPVPGADGYLLWIQYGTASRDPASTTASYDRLAVVPADQLVPCAANPGAQCHEVINAAINVDKTYGYKVQAFSGGGYSPVSSVVYGKTPGGFPLPPELVMCEAISPTEIRVSWTDASDNELGFIVQRQDPILDQQSPVPVGYVEIARLPAAPGMGQGVFYLDTGLQGAHPYNYQVGAYNSSGFGWGLPCGATTLGAPVAPSNLVATVIGGHQIDLVWTDNAANEDGFVVERSLAPSFATIDRTFTIATPDAAAFSDTLAAAATTYYYRVRSYNAGGLSPPSNTATATTPRAPPLAPSDLAATASVGEPLQVTLAWVDNSVDEAGFEVQRALDAAFTTQVVRWNVAADVTTFVDGSVQPVSTYFYRVRAFNAGTNRSTWSPSAFVTTGDAVPQPPSQLTAKVAGTAITLSWFDNSSNENGFLLERSRDGGATWTPLASVGPNVTSHRDETLLRRATFTYRVSAYNQLGMSAPSAPVTATTK